MNNCYTCKTDAWGCVTVFRPDGSDCAFLQGDDALHVSALADSLGVVNYPSGPFQSREEHLSCILSDYDPDND